jgi:hypothetical protein
MGREGRGRTFPIGRRCMCDHPQGSTPSPSRRSTTALPSAAPRPSPSPSGTTSAASRRATSASGTRTHACVARHGCLRCSHRARPHAPPPASSWIGCRGCRMHTPISRRARLGAPCTPTPRAPRSASRRAGCPRTLCSDASYGTIPSCIITCAIPCNWHAHNATCCTLGMSGSIRISTWDTLLHCNEPCVVCVEYKREYRNRIAIGMIGSACACSMYSYTVLVVACRF